LGRTLQEKPRLQEAGFTLADRCQDEREHGGSWEMGAWVEPKIARRLDW